MASRGPSKQRTGRLKGLLGPMEDLLAAVIGHLESTWSPRRSPGPLYEISYLIEWFVGPPQGHIITLGCTKNT